MLSGNACLRFLGLTVAGDSLDALLTAERKIFIYFKLI